MDGSGEFTVLADAVDAAASGDTIAVAPGDYVETRMYTGSEGNEFEAVAFARQSELSIFGTSAECVVLGPESASFGLAELPEGIIGDRETSLSLKGLTIRNTDWGVGNTGSRLNVRSCRFIGNTFGLVSYSSDTTIVEETHFEANGTGVLVVNVLGARNAQVLSSTFLDNLTGLDFQSTESLARDCYFSGGRVGLQVSFGGSAEIEACTFTGQEAGSVVLSGGSEGALFRNTIQDALQGIYVDGHLRGSGNIVAGGSHAAVRVFWSSTVDFHHNDILNSGGWSVLAQAGENPVRTLDFSNNYWGTDDPEQVAEWIHDRNEDEHTYVYIEYEPMLAESVPVRPRSMGSLRARFDIEQQ